MEMNNKEQFDFYVKSGILKADQDVVRVESLANRLLDILYKPDISRSLFIPNWQLIEAEGIDSDEPINWGDLSATVCKREGLFIVTIEEASPGECQTLCDYVEKYLSAWGWPVIIKTEW